MSASKNGILLSESSPVIQVNREVALHLNETICFDKGKAARILAENVEQQDGLNPKYESIGSKTEASVQDDENNFGFIIIKPEGEELSNIPEEEERKQEEKPNVFIIQNPEGLNPDMISQVRKVLAESGAENSVMYLDEADESSSNDKDTTTFIIDLNCANDAATFTSPRSSDPPKDRLHQHISHASSSASTIPSSSSLSLSSAVFKQLVNTSNESASDILNSSRSISNIKDPSFSKTDSKLFDNNILSPVSVSNSTCTNALPKNLNPSHTQSQSPSTVDCSSSSASISTKSSVTTSQVAEQIIHIAKKMIGDNSQGTQKISFDESLGKIVISSPESKSGEKSSSESVITMYLSSPNELNMKLKKLKTNSPVIVMQAGEEPLTSDENTENPLNKGNNDVGEVNADSGTGNVDDVHSTNQRSDSLAAALSSLTSGGVLYRCSECGYSSHNKHYYKQHVDLVHNEERPYKCPHCDYAGKRRHALLEHMVVHSNQRPYSCNHCNASFRKKGHLTNHVKLHMSHRLVHCGVCNIQLPDAEAFESHLKKIHNTDKLYKCKLCEHTVVDRRAMLTHLATHNESIVFSCPNCPSYFNNESKLLSHMKDVHDIVRKSLTSENETSVAVVEKAIPLPPPSNDNASTGGSEKGRHPANILCSECGFVCVDTQVMKKHMWVHIDSSSESGVQLKDQASSKKTDEGNPGNSAMGVLKMNVVSGLKSLPENIVYQCTSCKFTSSDNSVFIKHMLLHKTQRKQQVPATKATAQLQDVITNTPVVYPLVSLNTTSTSTADATVKEKKSDSSVPFVFDQESGRYRCLICGYHCDFQRTIKAHIWKHSGNQNIEYPVFEQVSKCEAPSSTPMTSTVDLLTKYVAKPDYAVAGSDARNTATTQTLHTQAHPRSSGNSPGGKSIQTLPFIPPSSKHGLLDLARLTKGGDISVSMDKNLDPISTNSSVKDAKAENVVKVLYPTSEDKEKSSIPMNEPSSPPALVIEDNADLVIELGQEQIESSECEKGLVGLGENKDEEDHLTVSKSQTFIEPSVVVEIVDSIPSSFGLTGMKSQQGSPRVSDLEGSGNEVKLARLFKEIGEVKEKPQELKVFPVKSDSEKENSLEIKYDLRRPKECLKTEDHIKHGDSKTVAVSSSDATNEISRGRGLIECNSVQKIKRYSNKEVKPVVKEDLAETMSNEESDGTASSDETVSAGESSSGNVHPPKSGICSSLLAVIEQLRERSRSETEKDSPMINKLPKRSSKRNKKSNVTAEVVSLSEYHNIEKIKEAGGEKFRCSLCHYTSQRICNMKIHMKTHRQKKPSECSLCDFASASPELLQEHMLQHCKVRTYACKFCPQSFNHKSTLRAHMRAHKDHEPFLCAYCVFETTHPEEYKEHMHVHSGCSSRLRCPGCDYIMNSKDELTPHLMKCKGKPPASSVTSGKTNPTNNPSDLSKSPKHKEVTNDGKAPQSSVSPSIQSTQHACVVSGCSFSSFNLKELQEHLSIHCNPSLMVCDLCDFKALHSRSLKSHMKRHANDQRYVSQPLEQYKCNLCGYVCHHLPSLKSHMWRHASDQSYSYEFTNDVINTAIDHDSRVDVNKAQPDDPELLVQFINSESRIMEGELTSYGKGDGQRPTCWVTFRCCSCGFETINKAKLNIHMRTHSDIIQQTLDVTPRKPGVDKSNHPAKAGTTQLPLTTKSGNRRSPSTEENNEPFVPPKVRKLN